MMGLKDWEPDEEKRYKHILENMIYVCELQPKNMFLWMTAVDPEDIYELNIYNGSFLNPEFDYHMKNVWGVEKFDLILGNPPYQDFENERMPLYQKFIEKSFNFLKEPNGYMVMVHPPAWRKPFHKLLNMFKERNLKYLRIHDNQDGQKVFGAGTRYDWYFLENKKYEGKTIIIDEKGVKNFIDIRPYSYIPHSDFDLFEKILAKDGEEKIEIIFSYSSYESRQKWMSKEKSEEFSYPCVHATSKSGVKLWYSKTNQNGHFGIPKIIMGAASPENGFFDEKGEYGMTQHSMGISVESKSEGEFILSKLNTNVFKRILNSTKFAGFETDKNILTAFKKDFWKELNDYNWKS
jgi:hypothetical protein